MEQYFILITSLFYNTLDSDRKELMTSELVDIHPNKIKRAKACDDGFTYIEFIDGHQSKLTIPFWEFVEIQTKLTTIDLGYETATKEYYKNRFGKQNINDKGDTDSAII